MKTRKELAAELKCLLVHIADLRERMARPNADSRYVTFVEATQREIDRVKRQLATTLR